MPLELAKELREAGFPNIQDVQHRQGREFLDSDGRVSVYSLGQIAPTGDWFIPTLSELIEACEENFDSMYRGSDGSWLAASVTYDDGDALGIQLQKGESKDSPEEAVARLWLALKQKLSDKHQVATTRQRSSFMPLKTAKALGLTPGNKKAFGA